MTMTQLMELNVVSTHELAQSGRDESHCGKQRQNDKSSNVDLSCSLFPFKSVVKRVPH